MIEKGISIRKNLKNPLMKLPSSRSTAGGCFLYNGIQLYPKSDPLDNNQIILLILGRSFESTPWGLIGGAV